MRVGRNWYITFDGVNLKSAYGLILSSYETGIPEAKTAKVSIPASSDIDITESIGMIGYHTRTYTFKFLLRGETETARKENLRAVVSLVHGVKANFVMSWDSGTTHNGRGKVFVEHLTPQADLVTIEIECDT